MIRLASKLNRNIQLSIACALATTSATFAYGEEGAMPDPLFSNDYVSVSRLALAPGEELPMHSGNARVVYSLSDYTIRWTEDGETEENSWREGEVHAHEALEHAIKNTGTTIADLLIVSRSDAALPVIDNADDAAAVPGGYAAVIADLEDVRVLRVALPSGAEQPLHAGAPRIVYSLNDYSVVLKTPGDEGREVDLATGSVHWHDAGSHAVVNSGDDTARFVIFAFR